jgi:hypothetical protein
MIEDRNPLSLGNDPSGDAWAASLEPQPTGAESLLEGLRHFGPLYVGSLAADERAALDGLVAEGKVQIISGYRAALTFAYANRGF